MSTLQPFDGLDPDLVLAAVESYGYLCDGHLLALNSYENRVYQVGIEGAAPMVAKFYRPARWSRAAILEEHGFAAELADRELPIVAPCPDESGNTLREHAGFMVAVYKRRSGSWPEMNDPARRRWMGRLMGRIHAVGAIKPFEHRPTLNAETFGDEPRRYVLDSGLLPDGFSSRYESVSAHLLELVRNAFSMDRPLVSIRVHGDCHGGNILWGDAGPAFVDLDDSRMAPAVQDLWMFLEGSPDERRGQLMDLLEGYEDFRTFDYREIRVIEALRALRLIHYAAWLGRRWDDPAFPQAFPWFGTNSYWEQHVQNLDEQCQVLANPDADASVLH